MRVYLEGGTSTYSCKAMCQSLCVDLCVLEISPFPAVFGKKCGQHLMIFDLYILSKVIISKKIMWYKPVSFFPLMLICSSISGH